MSMESANKGFNTGIQSLKAAASQLKKLLKLNLLSVGIKTGNSIRAVALLTVRGTATDGRFVQSC